jgi:hypothetical protein
MEKREICWNLEENSVAIAQRWVDVAQATQRHRWCVNRAKSKEDQRKIGEKRGKHRGKGGYIELKRCLPWPILQDRDLLLVAVLEKGGSREKMGGCCLQREETDRSSEEERGALLWDFL